MEQPENCENRNDPNNIIIDIGIYIFLIFDCFSFILIEIQVTVIQFGYPV
jgi:hypothetical protein